jgi:esterase/lipase superfamily enzyme
MAVPNLYRETGADPFAAVPEAKRANPATILFATDRAPEQRKDAGLRYGHGRSSSLAVGEAEVHFGDGVPWAVLASESLATRRRARLRPVAGACREVARYPTAGMYTEGLGGNPEKAAALEAAVAEADAALHAVLQRQLSVSRARQVHIFVHGYNVDFDAALTTIAQVWHFTGRDGAAVAYSWPAGRGGLRGYTVDRESGEFTITHLKRFIASVAASPEVAQVNLIAHSRGSDVVLTALRELYLASGCDGEALRATLKLGQVILAAPDIDYDLVNQRVASEGVLEAASQLTVYISEKDRALGLASWLFESTLRLGRLPLLLLTPQELTRIGERPALAIIDTRTRRSDLFGHSYFYQSPAVSSDVILVLQHGAAPGSAERPLEPMGNNLWRLDDDYPQVDSGP